MLLDLTFLPAKYSEIQGTLAFHSQKHKYGFDSKLCITSDTFRLYNNINGTKIPITTPTFFRIFGNRYFK